MCGKQVASLSVSKAEQHVSMLCSVSTCCSTVVVLLVDLSMVAKNSKCKKVAKLFIIIILQSAAITQVELNQTLATVSRKFMDERSEKLTQELDFAVHDFSALLIALFSTEITKKRPKTTLLILANVRASVIHTHELPKAYCNSFLVRYWQAAAVTTSQ